eukprot:gene6288-7833_t
MAEIGIKDVRKTYGSTQILHDYVRRNFN